MTGTPDAGFSPAGLLRLIGKITAQRKALGKDDGDQTHFHLVTSVGQATLTLGAAKGGYDYLIAGDGWSVILHVAYPITTESLTVTYVNREEAVQHLVALALDISV